MKELVETKTLNGLHSAHCGLCWSPVFNMWAADEAPDYTACPFGPYTAQSCPNETGAASRTALLAGLRDLSADGASTRHTPSDQIQRSDPLNPPANEGRAS